MPPHWPAGCILVFTVKCYLFAEMAAEMALIQNCYVQTNWQGVPQFD